MPILLNALAPLPDPTLLVLDDYYRLDAPPVDRALTFLLEQLPLAARLAAAARRGIASTFVRWLLTAVGTTADRTPVGQDLTAPLSGKRIQ